IDGGRVVGFLAVTEQDDLGRLTRSRQGAGEGAQQQDAEQRFHASRRFGAIRVSRRWSAVAWRILREGSGETAPLSMHGTMKVSAGEDNARSMALRRAEKLIGFPTRPRVPGKRLECAYHS